jgi:nucleoside phosphorylase
MIEAADPNPDDEELLRARDVLAERWARRGRPRGGAPRGVVLCHQAGLLGSAISRWRTRRVPGFNADILLLRSTGDRIAVAVRFGVGAPAAVALLEELVALGVRRFVSIGIVGGLRVEQKAGDLMVADRAMRVEGTSAHYLSMGPYAEPSPLLTQKLAGALERAGRPPLTGAVCSTDAPYRTTRSAAEGWKRAGGMAVDMEAAGLFAAARFRAVEIAMGGCLADGLSALGWRLGFDEAPVAAGVRQLFASAVDVLDAPEG